MSKITSLQFIRLIERRISQQQQLIIDHAGTNKALQAKYAVRELQALLKDVENFYNTGSRLAFAERVAQEYNDIRQSGIEDKLTKPGRLAVVTLTKKYGFTASYLTHLRSVAKAPEWLKAEIRNENTTVEYARRIIGYCKVQKLDLQEFYNEMKDNSGDGKVRF